MIGFVAHMTMDTLDKQTANTRNKSLEIPVARSTIYTLWNKSKC